LENILHRPCPWKYGDKIGVYSLLAFFLCVQRADNGWWVSEVPFMGILGSAVHSLLLVMVKGLKDNNTWLLLWGKDD
jgi:hypothetical protein